MSRLLATATVTAIILGATAVADAGIADTVHNMTTTGPGTVKEAGVGELCVFCHTPHRAAATRALWNRDAAPITYQLYQSSTLEATLSQPTGASRLCLSCHDGTTALGNLRVPPRKGRLTLGPLTGRAVLGTDLSDDHPVSFVYDSALAVRQGQLVDPAAVPRALRVDASRQMQCTTCHDPHDDTNAKFLRIDDRGGALCIACHRVRNWTTSTHATSMATWRGTAANPWPGSRYTTVMDNACRNCHRSHAAPHPARLLAQADETQVCLVCHNGSVAARNLEAEFSKPSAHPVPGSTGHDPRENPATMPRHVVCADCHNPHQIANGPTRAPAVPARMRGARGVSISGTTIPEASYGYEVCLKCHGVRDQVTALASIVRQDNVRNVRIKISPSNPSYHPIAAVGRRPDINGFEAGWSAGSFLDCVDCHNNDQWTPSGTQPRGPHGSRYAPILERNYDTADSTVESYQTYAMCYKCHNRNALLTDQIGAFPHRRHVVDQRSPCAACHDAHGSRQSAGLINFMLRDTTGRVVVGPSQTQHRLEYVALGPGRGQCFLSCHGKNHEPLAYP